MAAKKRAKRSVTSKKSAAPGSGSKRKKVAGRKRSTRKSDVPEESAATKTTASSRSGEESNDSANTESSRFAIVGIGASAGGLEAFQKFFGAMPECSDIAFVLIQHLDPSQESLTAELIGHHTAMQVMQATDEMVVQPNHVYVIPPNRYLAISGETLHLTKPVERRGIRVPIDFFLRSLADDQQERAIGIILSGTGSDGTLGAREIKAAGGMVMAQSPETAAFDGMPRSVVDAGVVDYLLSVEEMPRALGRYVQHWYVNGTGDPTAVETPPLDHLTNVVGLLRARLKYDFSCYKKGTLIRRVQRRMGLMHLSDMGQYVEVLRQNKDEITALYKDLLIGVTNFFREPDAWNVLQSKVIEPLVARATGPMDNAAIAAGRDAIRVWSAGCATGEEPYSIAMLLSEAQQRADTGCNVNVFASDLDTDALAFARAGIYPENIEADVSPERQRRFFVKGEHSWRINKDIREAVVFAEQNVISDPPFSKLDLISCRNLLIYLEPEIQKQILTVFHFALREGGCLFLGNAETVSPQHELFQPISRKWRIYRRVGPARPEHLNLSSRTTGTLPRAPMVTADVPDRRTRHLTAIAQHAVLQRFAPACVMVNHQGEILHLTGPVDDYLHLPVGEPAMDVFNMSRPGLRTRLRAGINQAVRNNGPVTLDDVRVKRGQQYFPVRVTIEPIRSQAGLPRERSPETPDADDHTRQEAEGLLLISFDDASGEQRVRVVYVEPSRAELIDQPSSAEEYEAVVRHLEGELTNTREDLQTTVEELETSNEEFKAANEEVTSINEELQSTNEELETSKEELQSMNEELQTVNSQLESKVFELESSNNDLRNLLTSIDQAILFLDRAFCIRRFTPAMTRLLRIIDADIGRPLRDLAQNFTDDDLLADADQVLRQLAPIEKEIEDSEGRQYVRRVVPYRTEDDHIGGVVITFIDITSQLVADAESRRLATIVRDSNDAISVQNLDGTITAWNRGAARMYGYTESQALQRNIADLVPLERRRESLDMLQRIANGERIESFETQRVCRRGRVLDVWLTVTPLADASGVPVAIATTERDITRRKEQERALQEAEARYADFFEHSPDMAFSVDAGTAVVLNCNQTAAEQTGFTKQEIIGRPVFELYHPDSLDAAHAAFASFVATGEVHNAELQLKRRDGCAVDVILNVTAVKDASGKIIHSRSVFRDVTERKRAQQQLAAMVEELQAASEDRDRLAALVRSHAMAIIGVRPDGTIEHWNAGAEELLGYSSQEAIGEPVSMLSPPDSGEDFKRVLEELEQGEPVVDFETVRVHRDGRQIDVALSVSLIRDESGQPRATCGIARSIADRKRLEQQLAELADRERQQFARDLHDTVGQQLTSLSLYAAALRGDLNDSIPDFDSSTLQHMESALKELREQVRLTYRGLVPVHLDADGLRVALTVMAEEVQRLHKVACRLECPESITLEDNFVATQLYLIAREAVHNAVKHGAPSEVIVRLAESDGLLLTVLDDGRGLPEQPDQQDGMGLQIMRYRSNMIGGRLRIESDGQNGDGVRVSCSVRTTEPS